MNNVINPEQHIIIMFHAYSNDLILNKKQKIKCNLLQYLTCTILIISSPSKLETKSQHKLNKIFRPPTC